MQLILFSFFLALEENRYTQFQYLWFLFHPEQSIRIINRRKKINHVQLWPPLAPDKTSGLSIFLIIRFFVLWFPLLGNRINQFLSKGVALITDGPEVWATVTRRVPE